ncbi:hypothetical protein A946_11590 [Methylacidiphilum kamchatkense Kam1]|uniref:Methyltransferase family protein n=1 Tax=Methylacidiphilum kamchatkense Kam1 TaxID=1202785 RepID=A0A0C1UPK9_9BACT|nr:class I SAM-dependent methyltransferase [Methylacidiphilum kamchatkense]KIE57733.1 hypothetical protein A946_11590 [Methylacidiphilum kamchatkense Kam1]QDQ42904.1 hypothetical protein kam1_1689 [Methylacidiphilum kamchatkense Kam1]
MIQHFYPEVQFGGFTQIDGTILFYTRIHALIEPHFIIADIGCGKGDSAFDSNPYRKELYNLRGHCKRVIGLDIDPDARDNLLIDEFRLIEDNKPWPLEDNSIFL